MTHTFNETLELPPPALREESQSQPQQAEGWKNQGVSLKGIKI